MLMSQTVQIRWWFNSRLNARGWTLIRRYDFATSLDFFFLLLSSLHSRGFPVASVESSMEGS